MRRRGAVQRKAPCLFVTEVKDEPSAKRERQVAGAAPGLADWGQAGGAGPVPEPRGSRWAAGYNSTDRVRALGHSRVARSLAVDLRETHGRGLHRILPLKFWEEGPSECRVSSAPRVSWQVHAGVHPDAVFAFSK